MVAELAGAAVAGAVRVSRVLVVLLPGHVLARHVGAAADRGRAQQGTSPPEHIWLLFARGSGLS
jgi:hypothetical protein